MISHSTNNETYQTKETLILNFQSSLLIKPSDFLGNHYKIKKDNSNKEVLNTNTNTKPNTKPKLRLPYHIIKNIILYNDYQFIITKGIFLNKQLNSLFKLRLIENIYSNPKEVYSNNS